MKKTLSLLLALCMVLALLSVGVFAADPQNEEPTPESAPETVETNPEPPETEPETMESAPETVETNTEPPETEQETMETDPETTETNPEPPETNAVGEDDAPLENLGPIPESWGTRDESLIFYTSLSVSVNVKLSITVRDSVVANASSWYLEVEEFYDDELVYYDPLDVHGMRFGEGQAGAVTNINGVAWRAVYTDLEPQELGTWYHVYLHVNYADGSSFYNDSPWMSVHNYVVGELMNPGNPDVVRTYCADLLNYNNAACFCDDLNQGLSDEEAAVKEAFETKTEAPATAENITTSPNIDYYVSWKKHFGVYFYTRNLQFDGTVQFQLKDHETGVVRHVLETTYGSGSTHSAFFNKFEAGDVRRVFDVVILEDGVEIGTPMTWCMETVIKHIRVSPINVFEPEKEVAMYNAMLKLNDSAVAALQP